MNRSASIEDEIAVHRGELLVYAYRLSGDQDQAEDIVHTAFVKALQSARSGVEAQNPRAWLYRIVHNEALTSRRRSRREIAALVTLPQAPAALDPAKASLPVAEGQLQSVPIRVDLDSETEGALQRRADVRLARLFVRAANEDHRIITADYYPAVTGSINGEYVPVTGIHRQGSTSRTQDFIGSEIRERAAYTWRVIDNGKVGGAVLRARSAREINELTCRKLEANIPRDLSHIANYLKATEVRERSLATASKAAEESARTIQQNVASGLASPLQYRVTENAFLESRTGLLDAMYQHSVATAEWDRATGRYFQFSDDTARSR